jgi:predicted nucleic acid-binding protein
MAFVLDSSVASSWAFRDEHHPQADRALERVKDEEVIFVPYLFWYELRNVLIVSERRGRISPADIAAFLRDIAMFDITADFSPEEAEVLRLARAHRLTVYDAVYLELAMRKDAALATLDKNLVAACKKEKLLVVGEGRAETAKRR